MPTLLGAHHTPIAKQRHWHRGWRVEEELDITIEGALILFDHQQILPTRRLYLLTQHSLTEQRIPGQHPPRPGDAGQQRRGHRQLRLRFVRAGLNWLMSQDDARVVAEGAQGVDRTASSTEAQPPPLRFAIDGDAPRCGGGRLAGSAWAEAGGERGRQRVAIELAKETLQGRLAGRVPGRKA